MQLILVKMLVREKLLLAVTLTGLSLMLLLVLSLTIRELGLSLVMLLILGSLLTNLWDWALERELTEILIQKRYRSPWETETPRD